MRFNWRTEWPQWLLIAVMFVIAAATWSSAPEHFPVHWNAYGEVDRYGSGFEGVLLFPLLGAGVYALSVLLPRIDPGRRNYAQFAGTYATVRLCILLFLALAYTVMQLVAHGYRVNIGMIVNLGIGALLVVVGNAMGKVRPNWFFGIRTPWTLSSKVAWDKTHRLGGWLFVAGGVAFATCVVLPPAWEAAMAPVILGTIVVVPVAYSYFVWRSDPDKQPPAGTMPATPAR